MKFISHIKIFILSHKFIFIGLTIFMAFAAASILYLNKNTETLILGLKTEKPVISISPTIIKTQLITKAKTVSPTNTALLSTNPSLESKNTSPATNQPTIKATDTPVPANPTQESNPPASSPQYALNGVIFNTQYPAVSLKPGEKKTIFTMTASGNKNFEIVDFRLIGSNGLGLSEMSGTISDGQTKEIMLTANPDAATGSYSGFIGIKIDGAFYDQPLRPTVLVEGINSENTAVLRLTGPSAGSIYNQGDNITITWEAANISGDFSLSIEGNSGDTYSFANVSNSERSYTWEAKKWFAPAATNFRFTITGEISGGSLIDHSDGDIIID